MLLRSLHLLRLCCVESRPLKFQPFLFRPSTRDVRARPLSGMPKPGFYAVAVGARPGIYLTWDECERQVRGHPNARHKKFKTESEALAFIESETGAPFPSTSSGVAPVDRRQQERAGRRGERPTFTAHVSRRSASPDLRNGRNGATATPLPEELRAVQRRGYTFTDAPPRHLVVYTDGSGLSNGQRGARAGCGVWWGSRGDAAAGNLAERVPGDAQTNNRGEILAVIRALETCPFPDLPLEIRTDSQYTIKCMTEYLPKWMRNGWLTGSSGAGTASKVKNLDMIKHLLVLLRRRGPRNGVKFKHVPAHVGVEGNEGADRLAKTGAMMPPLPDRPDWLDPDAEDEAIMANGEEAGSDVEIEVEVDPEWLMSAEELDDLEAGLA